MPWKILLQTYGQSGDPEIFLWTLQNSGTAQSPPLPEHKGSLTSYPQLSVFDFKDLPLQPTPEQITEFLWKNFLFEADLRQFGVKEYWQSPEEFWANRKGDCEDFARLTHELLKRGKKSSVLLNIYGQGMAHTVVLFKDQGNYKIIDNAKLRTVKAKDLIKVIDRIHPFWEKSAIVAPSSLEPRGRILKEIDRLAVTARG